MSARGPRQPGEPARPPAAAPVLAALQLVREGRIYSLESGWWGGMPCHPVHPRFEVLTYRSPHGQRVQRDLEFLAEPENAIGYGFVSELVMGTAHTGTHIDALCHVTCGEHSEWHGGHAAGEHLGDFGAASCDAAALGPMVARGVMLDVPRALGIAHCAPEYPITADDLRATADAQGTELRAGDVVLVRTGQMAFWPDVEAIEAAAGGSGLSLGAAEWLCARDPLAVGADTATVECAPSGVPGSPQPVHVLLVQQHGIPLLEWVRCEQLAADAVYEFAFIALPLTVQGATASMVRPIAVV